MDLSSLNLLHCEKGTEKQSRRLQSPRKKVNNIALRQAYSKQYRLSDHIDFQWPNIRVSNDFQLTSTFSVFSLLDSNYLRKPQTVTQSANFFLLVFTFITHAVEAIEPNEYEHISNNRTNQQKKI